MANEHYEYEGQEEGEYHFSDDQANYDMDMDTSAKDSAAVAVAPKESLTEKLKQHRRVVIGIMVFIVLLGIVYRLVTPSSNPVTDFQPAAATANSAQIAAKKVVTPPPVTASQPPVAQAPAMQPVTVTTTTAQAAAARPVMTAPAVVSPPPAAMPQQQPIASAQPAAITVPTTGETVVQSDKNVLDRVATLEQQNSAMMSLLQTQYAQKIADTELQNTQLRTQVQELNSRISNMEVAFRQLTKILRNMGSGAAVVNKSGMGVPLAPALRVTQPKISYTVQAIIPGRAWLKSDSGDTVTVAEGDMLKDYGRIAKIDPYDGIVDIDTGSKIVSLSYGVSGD